MSRQGAISRAKTGLKSVSVGSFMVREIIVHDGIFPRLVFAFFVLLSGRMLLLRTSGISACSDLCELLTELMKGEQE
jgi:hypothetical protein